MLRISRKIKWEVGLWNLTEHSSFYPCELLISFSYPCELFGESYSQCCTSLRELVYTEKEKWNATLATPKVNWYGI